VSEQKDLPGDGIPYGCVYKKVGDAHVYTSWGRKFDDDELPEGRSFDERMRDLKQQPQHKQKVQHYEAGASKKGQTLNSRAPKLKPARPCQPDLRAYGIAFALTFFISLPLSRFQIPSALLGSSVIFAIFAVGRLALHGQYGWFRDYGEIAMKLMWAMLAFFGGCVLFENYGVLAFLIAPITAMPVVYGLSLAWGLGENK
jgi:hypothetical protein